ncbi:hypothetical protein ACFY2M_25745 [Streptomyces sp. NPDC001276]|uniref:hypothetical protein n=1 Tax=Streptomyces sp. NPDC001276 TaxID=3364555 RepID=UPI00368767EF
MSRAPTTSSSSRACNAWNPLPYSLWFYYMGGKGWHTSWRQTALGRGWSEKDKFAYYGGRQVHKPTVLTTHGLNFFGDDVRFLIDIDYGGSVSVALMDQNGTADRP